MHVVECLVEVSVEDDGVDVEGGPLVWQDGEGGLDTVQRLTVRQLLESRQVTIGGVKIDETEIKFCQSIKVFVLI